MRYQALTVPVDLVAEGIPTSGQEDIYLIIDTAPTNGMAAPATVARCAGGYAANELVTALNS